MIHPTSGEARLDLHEGSGRACYASYSYASLVCFLSTIFMCRTLAKQYSDIIEVLRTGQLVLRKSREAHK
jgi:hypothetical protein